VQKNKEVSLIEILARIFTVVATAVCLAPIVVWVGMTLINHYFIRQMDVLTVLAKTFFPSKKPEGDQSK